MSQIGTLKIQMGDGTIQDVPIFSSTDEVLNTAVRVQTPNGIGYINNDSTGATDTIPTRFVSGDSTLKDFKTVDDAKVCCHPWDAEIETPQGKKETKDLEVGDEVWTYNFESLEMEKRKIKSFTTRQGDKPEYLVEINGRLRLTPDHPVFFNGLWQQADELQEGDMIRLFDGDTIKHQEVKSIEKIRDGIPETVVLELDSDEININYFANGILIHNAACA